MNFFRLAGRVIITGITLLLWTQVGHAQSSPFAGFTGSWRGSGTVALSGGTTERISCRASYRIEGAGNNLKQTLACASDSYKFDLSSDVTSNGNRVSGYWSETSRMLSGNLQGVAGGGKIDVFVESAGFAAQLVLRTSGNKQTVHISSKGEIQSVNITMVKS